MEHHHDEHSHTESTGHGTKRFLTGVLLGSLAGAGTMLLLAPQSGKKTRAKLQRATITLRDQSVAGIEDAVAQTKAKAGQITTTVREKAADVQQRGQALISEQQERWAPVLEAGQKAVQGPTQI